MMRWRDERINFQCQRVGAANHLQFPAFTAIMLNTNIICCAFEELANDLLVFNLVQFIYNYCLTLLSLPCESVVDYSI